ncbi:MFS transporter [uncultured Ilumatobacter sp.]|uniref:MFS transporter n=1 Tax=uncultured Ilumatobacter sp. TaxID=879968 RepID=UPI00374F1040
MTAAKAIANTALRWIPPFLPTLERAFGVSTTQLTTVLGLGETAGLSTVLVGKHLDRGRERLIMIGGLSTISVSSVIALGGSIWTFAVAFVLLILGVANFTVAGHAWISHRIDYRWRARSIGLFETSWALALLVGGPIIAILINVFGWRGPFVFLAVACALAALGVALSLPVAPRRLAGDTVDHPRQRLTPKAWFVVVGSATLAPAGLSIFVISGTWLDDEFGVSTGGLGLIVMGFGAFELVASIGTATFADRIGKMKSTLGGAAVVLLGLAVMLSAGGRLWVGVAGLLVLLIGFEYGFVTSLSLVSEAMPDARGTTLAIGNAVGTLTRGAGTILTGVLYSAYGIGGSAALSAAAAAISAACLLVSRRLD